MPSGTIRLPDQVEPDALVEGSIEAFGVKMPKDSVVQEETPSRISVVVPYSIERVATYFRERLSADSVDVGPRRTIFENARLKGVAGGVPANVSVNRNGTSTLVHVSRGTGFEVAPDVGTANPDGE